MQLPRAKEEKTTSSILPRRREAVDNPAAAWDLLDDLHRLPGIYGSAISTRSGKVSLSDTSDETKQPLIENLARALARDFREVVAQLNMGPMRLATIQSEGTTLSAAPVGPGMLVSVGDAEKISLAELRHRLANIQDELGRVEVTETLSTKNQPSRQQASRQSSSDSDLSTGYEQPVSPAENGIVITTDEEIDVDISDAEAPSDVALDEMQSAEVVDERGVVMVFIPGGTFLMGGSDNADEQPVHEVTISPFLIDKYPITNESYAAFLEESPLWRPGARNTLLLDEDYLATWENGIMPSSLAQHPVVWVSWWQALKGYCAWRDGRLPTEAEWEFAGRGTDNRVFPWGNRWRTRRCNHYRMGAHWTSPVGEFPEGRSPFGVMDMSGNVWEWCMDWYAPDAYTNSPKENPTGPTYGRTRSIRGGSRFNHANFVKLTKRLYYPPHRSDLSIGFRVVKPWPPKFLL